MTEIGTFEAKNRLSELLARAEKGERIYITRHGKRVALLTGVGKAGQGTEAAVEKLLSQVRAFRKRAGRGPESLKELIEEGR